MIKRSMPKTREPELAVFWWITEIDSFIGDRADVAEGVYSPSGDICELDYDHADRWQVWCNAHNLRKVEYDYYPRGKIIFNAVLHKFIVVCDACILERDTVKRSICREYGLDSNKVIWKSNDSYTCNVCRKEG